jgi:adenine-specific DNA-methyltransferase
MGFRYIGTKTQIVARLLQKIGSIVGERAHVADLMCGTATVSRALRERGYRVTAADVMTYSLHHARVNLLFRTEPQFKKAAAFIDEFCPPSKGLFPLSNYERMLLALKRVPERQGYFWREFCLEGTPSDSRRPRNYYSPDNAKRIDGIRHWIQHLREDNQITDLEHSLLIHDLIMAANDCANIAGTYGHYLSKTIERAKQPLYFKPTELLVMPDRFKHVALRGYAEDVAHQISCDLCYIDPPYMKRQYAANYHILETIAREDCPRAIGESGLRPWRDQYSDFCTKTRSRSAFRKVFENIKCDEFLISYSEDGLLRLQDLVALFEEFGTVSVDCFRHKRFRSNSSTLTSHLTEYLIHVKRE